MNPKDKEAFPPEVRVTATLLLDTEKKIEELKSQLEKLGKSESPTLNLNPPADSTHNKQNTPIANQRADITARMADLKTRSIQIVEGIEKKATPEVSQRVGRLKQDWIKDLEPAKDETKTLFEAQKQAIRNLNPDWTATEEPAYAPTPFQQNTGDIAMKKGSYMDQVRGLKEDYAYLEKDVDNPVLGNGKDAPDIELTKEDGPDIDIDED